ncbi:nucleoside deaminase [Kocuria marina]|uniref:nucleoside deaminase n=1 Tax=Kocuria marina TaxID=223184 RepID=UPI003460D1B5
MSRRTAEGLRPVMEKAVDQCLSHVDAGGLPFIGVVVGEAGVISEFGVNRVQETGDPSEHAEIVAMRDAMASQGLTSLAGTSLLATGEPCGLCYRFAIEHRIDAVYVAVDRDEAAAFGFDYRSSYPALGITDELRAGLFHHLPVERSTEPFVRYLNTRTPHARAPRTEAKGPSS